MMRHFKFDGQVYGYDEADETQLPLIKNAIDNGWKEITGQWPPKPSAEEALFAFESEAKRIVKEVAKSWGYDDMNSAASYVHSRNERFAAEARALLDWRDSVWLWIEEHSQQIMDGEFLDKSVQSSLPALSVKPD